MRYYENWVVTNPSGDVEFVGSFSKLLEHYNMTREQCFEMMKNDNFPFGKISKQKKYYDYNILNEDMTKIKGKSTIYHMFKKMITEILETEKDYPIDEDIIQSYFDYFEKWLCEIIIKLTTGNTVKNCKVLIKEYEYYNHYYSTEKRTQKLLCVALPKDIGYSFVFKVSDYILNKGHNNAYDLYKQVAFECVRSINKCKINPELKGRVCYHNLNPDVKVIDTLTGVVEPDKEGYTTRYYLNELNPDYYKQSIIYII